MFSILIGLCTISIKIGYKVLKAINMLRTVNCAAKRLN